MSDETGNPVEAFGGLVVLAFDLLDTEVHRAPDRLAQVFKSPALLQAAEKAMLDFAKARSPMAGSQLTSEEIGKLRSSIVDGVSTAAGEAYLKQIKGSTKFKALEAQLKSFEQAAKSSAIGVWVDHHKGILYVVGAVLTVGAGVALYLTKPTGPAYKMGVRELEKLKFDVVKLGSLKLGVGGIVFDPTADRYGGKITGKIEWEQLKIDVSLQVVATASKSTQVDGEVMVKYGVISLTGIVKQDLTTPKVDITFKLAANKDRFGLAVAAHVKDDNVTGSASASYKLNESLKIGVDLSRQNRADMGNQPENLLMFQLSGRFP